LSSKIPQQNSAGLSRAAHPSRISKGGQFQTPPSEVLSKNLRDHAKSQAEALQFPDFLFSTGKRADFSRAAKLPISTAFIR
jgi:hypothetical protein